jgi:hypothetical protein
MRQIIIIIAGVLLTSNLYAQSLKKYPIGTSGCSFYTFCDPGTFDVAKSPDGSDVYTAECNNTDVAYGVICVKLKDNIPDMKESEDVLVSYLDYLKTAMKITSSAGYGKGHRLKDNENTRGIIDYWKDKDNNWKIKGWTNGKFIVVLYVYSKGEIDETKTNVFLNSLVFAGS